MSSWTTFNIEGISPEQLPEEFDDWWVYEKDGMTVAYTFNRGDWSVEEAAAKAVEAGDDDVEPDVEYILAMKVQDTADVVTATMYRPREVKWTGVKPGLTWHGHHSFRAESSEFLDKTPDGRTPILAGNWVEYDEESPAVLLSELRGDSDD